MKSSVQGKKTPMKKIEAAEKKPGKAGKKAERAEAFGKMRDGGRAKAT